MADTGRRAIAEAITLLAQPDAMPAVFHCTAGKDRTGILAAFVMGHLGVSDDDIVDDYMLTLESRPERNAYLQVHEPEYYEFLLNLPEPFRDMTPEAITTLLAWIRREHGTVTEYLLACGVTPDTLDGLEANLLED
jgi:protein-tyrosine phosphatase